MKLQRYRPLERFNHWLTALSFVLLALSGLALFHPALFWLSQLFGGGVWMRILHPYLGVLMLLSFSGLVLRWWPHNLWTSADSAWLRNIGSVLRNHEDNVPAVGRYNAGQKLLFWLLVILMPLLLVSGVVIWRAWFAGQFAIDTVRWAALAHAVAAFALIGALIVHIYAALWVRGSIGAMVSGRVSAAWARKHHRAWYDQNRGV